MHYDSHVFNNRENLREVEKIELMLELQRGIKDFVQNQIGNTAAQHCAKVEDEICELLNIKKEEEAFGIKFPM